MYMGIDPSLSVTGWAIFTDDGILRKCGTLHAKDKKIHWINRIIIMTNQVLRVSEFHGIDTALIEFPQTWTWAKSGRSYASTAKGDLYSLAVLCGAISYALAQRANIETILLTPQTWRGSLSRNAVISAIYRRTGTVVCSHATNAVGIGLYHKEGDQWIIGGLK